LDAAGRGRFSIKMGAEAPFCPTGLSTNHSEMTGLQFPLPHIPTVALEMRLLRSKLLDS